MAWGGVGWGGRLEGAIQSCRVAMGEKGEEACTAIGLAQEKSKKHILEGVGGWGVTEGGGLEQSWYGLAWAGNVYCPPGALAGQRAARICGYQEVWRQNVCVGSLQCTACNPGH